MNKIIKPSEPTNNTGCLTMIGIVIGCILIGVIVGTFISPFLGAEFFLIVVATVAVGLLTHRAIENRKTLLRRIDELEAKMDDILARDEEIE